MKTNWIRTGRSVAFLGRSSAWRLRLALPRSQFGKEMWTSTSKVMDQLDATPDQRHVKTTAIEDKLFADFKTMGQGPTGFSQVSRAVRAGAARSTVLDNASRRSKPTESCTRTSARRSSTSRLLSPAHAEARPDSSDKQRSGRVERRSAGQLVDPLFLSSLPSTGLRTGFAGVSKDVFDTPQQAAATQDERFTHSVVPQS